MAWLQKIAALSQGGGVDITKLFKTTLYTGNGSTQSINTSLDMIANDGLVWIKNRDAVTNHYLTDTKRGNGVYIKSNTTDPNAATGLFDFDSDGFIVNNHPLLGELGDEVVAWNFIKSPKFFDVITYTGDGVTGREIPHNLGVQAGLVLVKNLDVSQSWSVQHVSRGGTKWLSLNSNGAEDTNLVYWNDTDATDSTVTLGATNRNNSLNDRFVMYVFAHDPDGVIQCGEYTANGLSPGVSVNLGWEPQYLMVKRATGGSGDWVLFDTARGVTTGTDALLNANLTAGENTVIDSIDFTATGFTVKGSHPRTNSSGSDYIYMAIRKPE